MTPCVSGLHAYTEVWGEDTGNALGKSTSQPELLGVAGARLLGIKFGFSLFFI